MSTDQHQNQPDRSFGETETRLSFAPVRTHRFDLHYHEVSKNYRVLVDGHVHPLLCGLADVRAASAAVLGLFGPLVDTTFDNKVVGPQYFNHDSGSDKAHAIAELERAIRILKGTPSDQIDDIYLQIDIQFKGPQVREPMSPEMRELTDNIRIRSSNDSVSRLLDAFVLLNKNSKDPDFVNLMISGGKRAEAAGKALDTLFNEVPGHNRQLFNKVFETDPAVLAKSTLRQHDPNPYKSILGTIFDRNIWEKLCAGEGLESVDERFPVGSKPVGNRVWAEHYLRAMVFRIQLEKEASPFAHEVLSATQDMLDDKTITDGYLKDIVEAQWSFYDQTQASPTNWGIIKSQTDIAQEGLKPGEVYVLTPKIALAHDEKASGGVNEAQLSQVNDGKSVICQVCDPHEMPVDDNGTIAEQILQMNIPLPRPGQLEEEAIRASLKPGEFVLHPVVSSSQRLAERLLLLGEPAQDPLMPRTGWNIVDLLARSNSGGFKAGELIALGVLHPSQSHKSTLGWNWAPYDNQVSISPEIDSVWVANTAENWGLFSKVCDPAMTVDRETSEAVELRFNTAQEREDVISVMKQSSLGVVEKPQGIDD